jgi:flagellar hook-associated protein 3 FlgL
MRVADKMNFDQVKSNLSKNRSDMAELQNQAALQKRITKPSDDPLAATRVLAARTEIAGNQQFLKSVGQARAFLEYSDQSLGELSELLMRAKELAISQSSDASASANTREVTAAEVEQLFHQSVQVGNRKYGDRFLFAGFKTTRAPFDAEGNYKGDSGEIKIAINKEASVAMNLPGDRIFIGTQGRNAKVDNAQLFKKTDSASIYQNPPQPEPQPEAIERPAHPTEGPTMRGPASVESEKQNRTEHTEPDLGASWRSGGINVFSVLRDLETGLRANDKESVQDSLDQLDSAIAQVVLSRAQLGARVQTLNSSQDTLQKGQVDAKGLASNLEDVDTFELVSDLNKTESTLKASLATSGKLIQPSLLDFIK